MSTYLLPVELKQLIQTEARQQLFPVMAVSARGILALLIAVTAATAFALISVWVAAVLTVDLIDAGTWGLGFIFLGLATDNRRRTAILQLITGIVLLGLALLQAIVSPDFTIVSGAVVTSWVAFTVFRQLR